MNLLITLLCIVAALALVIYASWNVDAALRRTKRLPLAALSEVAGRRARVRIRVLGAVQPVRVPVSQTECCAYQVFLDMHTSDQPVRLFAQADASGVRVSDGLAERILYLRGRWDLHHSLGESREVTSVLEREAVERMSGLRVGKAGLELFQKVVTVGMLLDVAGDFVSEGDDLAVWQGLLAPAAA